MNRNNYRVSANMWDSFGPEGQRVFNEVYGKLIDSQGLFSHPDAKIIPQVHWQVFAWNAASVAAWSAVRRNVDLGKRRNESRVTQ